MMTTESWRNSTRRQRLKYRVVRHPLIIVLAYLTIFFFSVTLLSFLRRPARYWDSALSLLAHGTAIDLSRLVASVDRRSGEDVLNGIAYDEAGDRLFVTGKNWPSLYQIRIEPPPGRS